MGTEMSVASNARETVRAAFYTLLMISTVSCVGLAADECGSAELRLVLHEKNPQVIRSLEKQWTQAYASRDTERLSCILGDDFEIGSMPDQGFATHNKQHVLEWVATRTGSAELEQLLIKPHDGTVMAIGVYSVRRDGKLVSRFQFTDVFVYRSNRWQAVARAIAELPLK
jgi:hypothetical protein